MNFKKPSFVILTLLTTACIASSAEAARWRKTKSSSHQNSRTPRNQAPYKPGASPYVTGIEGRPRYYVPPTIPRTPTWKMYGTEPGVAQGDWPRYAPFGFGGYRFPAVGNAAYR
ncbi:MAG: hypothetical protein MUQ67_02745 [Pirellulales bacterium]|jgi:hypothetical protein|nr:hypothetical protein [Pirellulales bacterium]MDO7688249.1 hypothetical protein [Pirellulales bacterium]